MKHTPEPWMVGSWYFNEDGIGSAMISNVGETYEHAKVYGKQGNKEGFANGDRIVACVNACAGMEDPATEIKALREANEVMREALDEADMVLASFAGLATGEGGVPDWIVEQSRDSAKNMKAALATATKLTEQTTGGK